MFRQLRLVLIACALLWGTACKCEAQSPTMRGRKVGPRPVVMEVFVRTDRDSATRVESYVQSLERGHRGIEIRTHDVLKDQKQLERLYALSKRMGRDKPVLPAFYACDRMFFGFTDAEQTGPGIEALLTANLYTRATCPKCQKLKAFLPQLEREWPGIRFAIHDVDRSGEAMRQWKALCQKARRTPGLPTIDFARRIIVGYQGDAVTGAQLRALIEAVAGKPSESDANPSGQPAKDDQSLFRDAGRKGAFASISSPAALPGMRSMILLGQLIPPAVPEALPEAGVDDQTQPIPPIESVEEELREEAGFELPEEALGDEIGETKQVVSESPPETIKVPFFGELNASELGMPVFTVAIGLVDGFNPCAMWVLVFLLSVLVNIKDRRKILLIAGTFVVVSGLAYFAFMAAWLNVFMLVGIARPVQLALAALAILIGLINVKDFFAFKKGISLSIPESQKPGLYRRVREIVSTKYLSVALGSAIVLAIIVNMIELLCTAGLPALYTQVLTMQEYPVWKNYAYLGLYIAAYMFDDAVLVAIVVVTLSHRKLQEREGRWLKLVSGLVILSLGLVMLFRPEWLQLGT